MPNSYRIAIKDKLTFDMMQRAVDAILRETIGDTLHDREIYSNAIVIRECLHEFDVMKEEPVNRCPFPSSPAD